MRISALVAAAALLAGATFIWNSAAVDEKSIVAAAEVDGAKLSFAKDVKPILADRCFGCHNPAKKKGGVDLQGSFVSLMRTVKEGNPDDSKLYKSLVGRGAKRMPPKKEKQLSDQEISKIKAWIAAGAKNN